MILLTFQYRYHTLILSPKQIRLPIEMSVQGDAQHSERRMEGNRQLNLQLAAARAGTAIPPIDASIVREEAFIQDNSTPGPANPMERYLQLEPQQDAYVIYTRTATQNELKARGIFRN